MCGLMPMHLSKGVPMDSLSCLMTTYHTMVLEVLHVRAARVDTLLFDKPCKPHRMPQCAYM